MITVITPCYNVAHTIHRVWEGLNKQTYRDFEWIVIDDDSTDITVALLITYFEMADFPVVIICNKKNMGLMETLNRGIASAHGEIVMEVDADNSMTPDCLQVFADTWEGIPANKREQYWCVLGLSNDQNGQLVGTRFPDDLIEGYFWEAFFKHKVKGEKCWAARTDILRDNPFAEVDKYVPKSCLWSVLGNRYKYKFVNKVVKIYYVDEPGSITSQNPFKYALGFRHHYRIFLKENIKYWKYDPVFFAGNIVYFALYTLLAMLKRKHK